MESKLAGRTAVSPDPANGTTIVDTDVHEGFHSIRDLVPYLDTHWQRYLLDYGWTGSFEPKPFDPPTAAHPWEQGKYCADVAVMSRELLDEMGVDIAIINNSVHQFGAQAGWFELNTALARAYNDFVLEHWLEREPRLRGSVTIVPNDPTAAAREIDRIGSHPQVVQVLMPVVMDRQYGEAYYHPIYEAAVRNGLAIAMHHGSQTKAAIGYGRYFIEWHSTAMMQGMMCQVASMVLHGVFDRFPELMVVGLEAGFTWLPSLMWRMDRQYAQFRHEVPWVKRKPSDHLRDHLRLATQPMEDLTSIQLMSLIGMIESEDVIVFSSDYPHYDGDRLETALPGGLPDALRRKIMSGNALATYARIAPKS